MGCLQSAGMGGGGAPKGLPVGDFKLMPSHQPCSLEHFRGKPVVVHLYTGPSAERSVELANNNSQCRARNNQSRAKLTQVLARLALAVAGPLFVLGGHYPH